MNAASTDLRGLTGASGADGAATRVPPPASRWRLRLLLPGVILSTVVLLLLFTALQTLLPSRPVRVVPVVVKTVEGTAGTVTVQAPGWLEPDPHPQYVTALADGVVESVLVLAGEPVEAGQVVARLVDDDARLALRRAESSVAQRRAERAAAQADLVAAKLRLEHLVETTRAVAVADARAAEARAELQRVRADIAVEQAQLLEIRDEYDRKSKLTASQAVSEATVARLRLRVDAQQAVVDATSARQAVLEAKLAQAVAELEAARTNRTLLIDEQRAVALAQATVDGAAAAIALAETVRDEAALRLDRMAVRSPVSGIVMRRLASPGSKLAHEGDEHSSHVVHVYDPRHMQVRVDVPLADAAQVTIDQAVEVTVEVLPDRTFTGRVTRVVHEADIQKNTVEVKVAIDDPTSELKPEMLARVRFLARPATDGKEASRQRIFAPQSLLQPSGDGEVVAFVVTGLVDERGRAVHRRVSLGRRAVDGWIEVADGLQVGDLLIADPPPDLRSGDRIRVVGEQRIAEGG
ncbi:MAG: efflux RND transporter periplasmic adaptor subunit [Planctomycetota bacterium]|jgi:RND family efflux transporter MFP subunit